MKKIHTALIILALAAFGSCRSTGVVSHTFDSSQSIDAFEFTIDELNLPSDWEAYDYLVLEIRSSTAQRFLMGIDTDNGLHEKRTHLMPQAWLRVSFPLEYYREKPRPSGSLASTVNKPRGVAFQHIEGGTVGPLTGVKGLSIKYYTPLDNPVIEIRSATLATEDPGSAYLGTEPLVDEFGQWVAEFDGKIHSMEELEQQWAQEEAALDANPNPLNWSKYGGFADHRVEATGWFRTEKIDGRWWFVDPDGHLFLSILAVGINPGGGGSASEEPGLRAVFSKIPPLAEPGPGTSGGANRPPSYMSYGEMNQRVRYGDDDDFRQNWAAMTTKRMRSWGLNTGSSDLPRTPYMTYLRYQGVPTVFGLQDIYGPDYESRIEEGVKNSTENAKNDPYLIGYFLQNEPSWLEQEPRVCELILSGEDMPLKKALTDWLAGGDTPARREQFVHNTFRRHIETMTRYMKKYDPNHLSLGIRFGHSAVPHPEILSICKDYVDVFSFNTYRLMPNMDYLNEVAAKTGLPLIDGEFHFGTIDRGMATGLVQVSNQQERAGAMRYFMENAFSNPNLIGLAWFQYTDQGFLGRGDGERYNIGLIDVTDRPYPIVEGLRQAAENAYAVHAGQKAPYSQIPKGVRGNEDDLRSMSNQ
jgi:hypothetical protein